VQQCHPAAELLGSAPQGTADGRVVRSGRLAGEGGARNDGLVEAAVPLVEVGGSGGAWPPGGTGRLATSVAADVVELGLDAPLEAVTARIAHRRAITSDPSEATEDVAVPLRGGLDPGPKAVRETTASLEACVDLAETAL
jgi:hypothetical protein